jgi:hypothetical protein
MRRAGDTGVDRDAKGPIPLRFVPELRDEYLERAHPHRLSDRHPLFSEITARHSDAVARGEPCYDDPATGLTVFTAQFLAERGYCCDSACRHCPYVIG